MMSIEFTKYKVDGAYHWRQGNKSVWNKEFSPPLRARYDRLVGLIPKESKNILEIGCGDGYLLCLSNQRCPSSRIYGIDMNDVGIGLARQEFKNRSVDADLKIGSAYSIDYPDNFFDVVIMADVIEHLEDRNKSLSEAKRVLAKNGVFLLSTPNNPFGNPISNLHTHEYTFEELKAELNQHFNNVELSVCWRNDLFEKYVTSPPMKRRFTQITSVLGLNPFLKGAIDKSDEYIQLIAKCAD
jgi:ubiquinone/menaquinone biosynthesis C-methylase UbiE